MNNIIIRFNTSITICILFLLSVAFSKAQNITMQNGTFNQCNGIFYDSGGDTNGYNPNENFVITICPDSTDSKIVLEFIEFGLSSGGTDSLTIYDSDIIDPTLEIGSYSGSLSDSANDILNYVTASNANLTGCLTLEFVSDGNLENIGWEALISCREACPIIDLSLLDVQPGLFEDPNYQLCKDEQIVFTSAVELSSGNPNLIEYEWDFDNGDTGTGETASTTFDEPGFYDLTLTATYPGCDPTILELELYVSDTPDIDLSTNFEQICINEEVELSAIVESVPVTKGCDLPVETTTFLADGIGNVFTSTANVDCFDDTQILNDINDIIDVCITIEHSFLGDLEIALVAPNGTEVILKEFSSEFDTEDQYLGEANEGSGQGVGYEYCFSMSASDLLVDGNTVLINENNPPDEPSDFAIESGTYLPVDPFSNLLGTTFNGNWSIKITDNIVIDDGYLFSWNINFNTDLIPEENIFIPFIVKQEWVGFEDQGDIITTILTEEGLQCFEYEVIDSFGCVFIEEICIEVLPAPTIFDFNNLFECNENSDTPTEFDLTVNDALILGSQNPNNYILTYHTSMNDALNTGDNPIDNPEAYIASPTETIYIRLMSILGECVTVDSFQLFDDAFVGQAPKLDLCSSSGVETFNITQNESILFGNNQNATTHTISYHLNETDADFNINPISDPTAYENLSSPETIWVRIENNEDTSCYGLGSFVIETFIEPSFNIAPIDIERCNTLNQIYDLTKNNEISLDIPEIMNPFLSYHTSLEAAQNDIDAIPNPSNYQAESDPQTIWIRIENQNFEECYITTSFQLLTVESTTVNLFPTPLLACDDNNDGLVDDFILEDKKDEITLNNTGLIVKFFLTEADAMDDDNPIESPYANITPNSQTIYFSTEDVNNGCREIGSLDLNVVQSPLLVEPTSPLVECINENDNFPIFDLTQIEAEVLQNVSSTSIDINYYLSLSDAETGFNDIVEPQAYASSMSTETLWVKVTDTSTVKNCENIVSFDIEVNQNPTLEAPTPLEVCDDPSGTSNVDGIAEFNLINVLNEIIGDNQNLEVNFYESLLDIESGNAITDPENYTNLQNPQTLEVEVRNIETNCTSLTNLTLIVNPLPFLPDNLEAFEVCDKDNDGFDEFDLQSLLPALINNDSDANVTFHLTQEQADLGTNAIDLDNPFANNNPNTQTIFIRKENIVNDSEEATGCYNTLALDLIVNPAPEIETINDIYICDDDSFNGFAIFDLTQNTNSAIGNQNASISYYTSQSDAESGINPIANPTSYTNITNPQTIYIRLEDNTTGCVDVYDSIDDQSNTFELHVEPYLPINVPSELTLCDVDFDENSIPQETFDLTTKESEILGTTGVPDGVELIYFLSEVDLQNDTNPISNPNSFTNQSNPQDIFVKVVNNNTVGLCSSQTVLTIRVLPKPTPSETDPEVLALIECDDDNDGIAATPFDLTISGAQIIGSENVVLSYFTSESGAQLNEDNDKIDDPTAYINEPSLNLISDSGITTNTQEIFVRLENNVADNSCIEIISFYIRVLPAPQLNPLGSPFAYSICEDSENPGTSYLFSIQDIANNLWEFNSGDNSLVIPLLDSNFDQSIDLEDYNLSYHWTEEEAEDGLNAIIDGTQVNNQDVLYIRCENKETLCYNTNLIGRVVMMLDSRPEINDGPLENLIICASSDDDPNVAMVDLTSYDELINPDTSSQTFVVYYDGIQNYNNANPIEDPSNFTTSSSVTTVFAEVVDAETFCTSADFLNFDVFVNPLPLVDLSAFDGLPICYDEFGNLYTDGIDLPIIDTGLPISGFSYQWEYEGVSLSATGPSLEVDQPGIYSVTATNDLTGCSSSESVTITESTPPQFEIEIISEAFSDNHRVKVTLLGGSGHYEFKLDDGEWVSLQDGQDTLFFNNVPFGLRTVTGRDIIGCAEIVEQFTVIDYPKYFTPNEDSFNDTWNIPALADQDDAVITIFDRYGKFITKIKPSGEGWTGNFNNAAMPSQTYWFSVEYTEPISGRRNVFKSHFILKR